MTVPDPGHQSEDDIVLHQDAIEEVIEAEVERLTLDWQAPAVGSAQSYTFVAEDVCEPFSWYGQGAAAKVLTTWTPTVSGSMTWLEPVDNGDPWWSSFDVYLWKGDVPNVDYPGITEALSSGISGQGLADAYPGFSPSVRVEAGQPYTVILVCWANNPGESTGAVIDLAATLNSMAGFGGLVAPYFPPPPVPPVLGASFVIAELPNGTLVLRTDGSDSSGEARFAHAEGIDTSAIGFASHAEGDSTTSSSPSAHAEGRYTTASSDNAHAEGNQTTASAFASHAEGMNTSASGSGSHAEGRETGASGAHSHTEGYATYASGIASHAEGGGSTLASGQYSHAEGWGTKAEGLYGHSEGYKTEANGAASHAEGEGSIASGYASHSRGGGLPFVGAVRASVQYTAQQLSRETTGIAATPLIDGAGSELVVRNDRVLALQGMVVARRADGSVGAAWAVKAMVRVSSGFVTLQGAVVTLIGADTLASTWSVAFSTATNTVRLLVTGQSATTIHWAANIETEEVN